MPRVKQLNKNSRVKLYKFPNFSSTGSIKGMKKLYYGKDALLAKSKGFIYNVSSEPSIYFIESH